MNLNRSHCNFNKLLTLYNLSPGVALRLKEAYIEPAPSRCVQSGCRQQWYERHAGIMIKQPKPLKINEFILSCPRFALSLHKKSCISAYRSSELDDSALDLHCLCRRKAASRHNVQASLTILLSICIIFAQEKLHLEIFYAGRPRRTAEYLSRTNNYIP